jgi:hypothetical protein
VDFVRQRQQPTPQGREDHRQHHQRAQPAAIPAQPYRQRHHERDDGKDHLFWKQIASTESQIMPMLKHTRRENGQGG